jgi:predicted HTH transcriptional regulator
MDGMQLQALVRELTTLPAETEWVEFKHNKTIPDEIGECISALANSCALQGKPCAYIIGGVEDGTHRIVGTSFLPREAKVGNEELENWLAHHLTPRIAVHMHEIDVDGTPIVLFAVQPATNRPVRFKGAEYIRIGSYKKKLHDHPEKEREIWRVFERTPFESGVAQPGVSSDDVLSLIDFPNYFRMMQQPLSENRSAILERLVAEKVLVHAPSGTYDVSNVGAILFARDLRDFERLARKALRVIIYWGDNRVETIKEQTGGKGYAIGDVSGIDASDEHL